MAHLGKKWTSEHRQGIADRYLDEIRELKDSLQEAKREASHLKIDLDTTMQLLNNTVPVLRMQGQRLLDANRGGLTDEIEDTLAEMFA